MPRIPQYGEPQVNERPLSLPATPTDIPLDAFGGGRAAEDVTQQAVGFAGDVQHREMQRYREHYQDAVNLQALEISNKLTAEATRAKGALTEQQGKAAIGGRDRTLSGYDKFYQDIEKDINNDDVKRVAYAHFLQHKQGLDAFATPYESAQVRQYGNDELMSQMKVQQESAAADPTPANVAVASMSQKLALEEFAQRNGKGSDWVKAQQQDAGGATHFAALHALAASGNDKLAKQFYDDNKGEFFGNDAIRAAQLVENTSYRGEAQREVARITSPQPLPEGQEGPTKPPTEKETYAAADKIEDPKLKDMVTQRLDQYWAREQKISHDAEMKDLADAANIIEGNPSVDAIPAELYDRLPMGAKTQIRRRIKQIIEENGPQPVSDKYLGYVREQAQDPDTFVKRNFAAMRDEITDHEAQELTKDQRSIIMGDERTGRKNNSLMTPLQILDSRMRALSISDDDIKNDLKTAVTRDYFTWKRNPANAKRPIEPEEAELLVSRLLGRKKAFWQFWGKEETPIVRNIQDVPDADRQAARAALIKNGIEPTEGAIIEEYNSMKKK